MPTVGKDAFPVYVYTHTKRISGRAHRDRRLPVCRKVCSIQRLDINTLGVTIAMSSCAMFPC